MTEHDRRGALAMVTRAGVAVSALVLSGCSRKDEEAEEGGEVTANEDLMREHGVLRRILIAYRETAPKLLANAAAVDAAALAQAAALFRDFGETYHEHLLEEQHIFPQVRKAGGEGAGLIDTLLDQHKRGRAITSFILDRTKNGSIGTGDAQPLAGAMLAFARMYEAHTAREDTVIFPAFKASLGEKAYRELGDQFEDIEHKQFGGDGFDIALDKVAKIEQALGIPALADMTAPAPPSASRPVRAPIG
ncbi:MAG: hemerythrin domain-containing protein [Porphyrobacter sp.]|nr:hemerythrin domain-containing protein [Porphyrobacter sp.]